MRPLISSLTIWPLSVEMRQKFKHAAAERSEARPLILQIELQNGAVGFGETHARLYVTGEQPDEVADIIRETFLPLLLKLRPQRFEDVVELAAGLPERDAQGRIVTATRALVELALLDVYSRFFEQPLTRLADLLPECRGASGSLSRIRYSGVVSADSAAGVRKSLWKMWIYGLRHFKVKVGDAADDERIRETVRFLGKPIRQGRASLRIDANGAWNLEEATRKLFGWRELSIAACEQPLSQGLESELAELKAVCAIPLMADESLVTMRDAAFLIENQSVDWFNIRLAKNGGLIPALRMAKMASESGIGIQLGCLVGETSVLSSAGRWFLQLVDGVQFAEGSFGRFLLQNDIGERVVQFGYGGRGAAMTGLGWGVSVRLEQLRRLCRGRPIVIAL